MPARINRPVNVAMLQAVSLLTSKRGKKDGKVVRCRTDLYAVPRPAPRSTTEIQGLQHWVPVVQGRDIQKHLLSQETRKLGRSHGIMYFLTSHMSTRRHVSVVSKVNRNMECSHDAHDNAWRYGAFFRSVSRARLGVQIETTKS